MINPNNSLNKLAQRYVWWESIEWSYAHPIIFLGQVMNLGSWPDLQTLLQFCEQEDLKQVLQEAPAGIFNYRSWDYWHLKLGFKSIPPLPTRQIL